MALKFSKFSISTKFKVLGAVKSLKC